MDVIERFKLVAPQTLGIRIAGASLMVALGWYVQNLPGEETPGPVQVASAQVLVLAQEVAAGAVIDGEHLQVLALDPNRLPPNALAPAQLDRISGLLARRPLSMGQVLTLHDLRAPAATAIEGAELRLPTSQFEGLGSLTEPAVRDLYGAGLQIRRATLTPMGESIRVQVQAGQRDDLAKLSRGVITAVACTGQACLPTLKPVPVKPRKAPRVSRPPSALRVTYAISSGEQP